VTSPFVPDVIRLDLVVSFLQNVRGQFVVPWDTDDGMTERRWREEEKEEGAEEDGDGAGNEEDLQIVRAESGSRSETRFS
jgi:hypothetical protein